MRRMLVMFVCAVSLSSLIAYSADDKKDTRAGSCDDAKKQMDYFCKANPNDTMVSIGTACTNAKNNVKAACEGVVEADKKYEFKDK